jgi:F-type H+-transporting ATPase subunit delta
MATKNVVYKIVEPYAEALLELAVSKSIIDQVNNDMNTVSQLLYSSSDLQKFLSNPLASTEAKKKVICDIWGEQITKTTLDFLMVLVNRNRIAFLDAVAEKYLELSYKQASIEIATVTSAVQLTAKQQSSLKSKLSLITGAEEVKLQIKVDPDLIGGFVVEIGSKRIDTSVVGQLERISSLLSSASV